MQRAYRGDKRYKHAHQHHGDRDDSDPPLTVGDVALLLTVRSIGDALRVTVDLLVALGHGSTPLLEADNLGAHVLHVASQAQQRAVQLAAVLLEIQEALLDAFLSAALSAAHVASTLERLFLRGARAGMAPLGRVIMVRQDRRVLSAMDAFS